MIAAEGDKPTYPGFSAVEPKMEPWVFYFDTVLDCLTEPYIMFIISTESYKVYIDPATIHIEQHKGGIATQMS